MGRPRIYSPDEAATRQSESIKQWKKAHREKVNECMKKWRSKHREKIKAYNKLAYLRRKFSSLTLTKGEVIAPSHKELIEMEPLILHECQNMTQVKVALTYHISRRTVQRIVAKHNPNSKYYETIKAEKT